MKITAAISLVLAVLFSTVNRPPDPELLNLLEDPHVSSELGAVSTLTLPILSMVTLPGLSENDINIPLIVPGVDTGLHPSWQVYLSIVPIQNSIANRHELFSPIYVGSSVLQLPFLLYL